MEYKVKDLGDIAGVTAKTIRYYDKIGILKASKVNSLGHRIYCEDEVDRLQQILLYRELDVYLDVTKEIITSSTFDSMAALKEHKENLIKKRDRLDLLISTVENTIALKEGSISISDEERFKGFKKNIIEDKKDMYGEEAREMYGKKSVSTAKEKVMSIQGAKYDRPISLETEIKTTLAEAFKSADPSSELAQKAADLHRQWIASYWGKYTKKAHADLARMYPKDERFKEYYDNKQVGTAAFLRDAILIYTGFDE
ncbi:transcriptional regulator [Clostridium putrefaciens]|uniref:Transcriptional regulator n=1 Tax=Clostridium putrefaciens TaxID=99675 RepID=A0A381J749_9CLOT|nr:MerR family transcriptional regulator [Clostridium putrefaciens]SUY46054.1 transcriptional regulator [Clostridium putrefaciens]